MSRPIIVYAYNRPEYLDQVLEALKPQVKDAEVFLFQDGPRIRTDDKPKVKKSVEVFTKHFPKAKQFVSDVNLGVAFNQKRAREFIFNNSDSAIFIEDDIVLNSYYLEQLNFLMDKFQDDKDIGMISCFGESHRHPNIFNHLSGYLTKYDDWDKQQERNNNKFMQMEHLWAYGFFRHAYEKIAPFMEGYYAMLPDDYRAKPIQQIMQYLEQYDFSPNKIVPSQDSVTSGFLIKNNFLKLSTFTLNAQTIGKYGEHSNEEYYNKTWRDYKPYNKFVKDFTLDQSIKEKILYISKTKFMKNMGQHP